MRGVGWEAHVTSRDPTLDAVGTRSCAIRRGMSKKRVTAIFDRSLRVGPPSLCVLRGLLCKSLCFLLKARPSGDGAHDFPNSRGTRF